MWTVAVPASDAPPTGAHIFETQSPHYFPALQATETIRDENGMALDTAVAVEQKTH